MNTIFRKEITIHDKDGKRFDLEITNEGSSTGPYFSICSQSGQGRFNPKSDIQQHLLDIWDKYHLNGMNPGTKKQMDILKSYKDGTLEISELMKQYLDEEIRFNKLDNYGINRLILCSTNKDGKLQIHSKRLLENGKLVLSSTFNIMYNTSQISEIEAVNAPQYFYDGDIRIENYIVKDNTMLFDGDHEYGHGWCYVDFPENFQEDLFKLIDDLIEEEKDYSLRKITIEDLNNEDFIEYASKEGLDIEKLMAACLHCGVSWSGLENVNSSDNDYWDIEGFEYSIYTDEEANEAHRDYIENLVDDIGFEGFNGGKNIDVDIDEDDWITISKKIQIGPDERQNSLAGYDGHEHEVSINGTRYYLYKQ